MTLAPLQFSSRDSASLPHTDPQSYRRSLGPGETLCANMSETLPPSEFRVEGGEGMRDEYPARDGESATKRA